LQTTAGLFSVHAVLHKNCPLTPPTGALPPGHPLGALPPDPRYRLRARHEIRTLCSSNF